MMALAPGRFSTMPGWPQSSPIFCASVRACRSIPEPAACGTMMRMGRFGKLSAVCATAPVAAASATALVNASNRARLFINAPPLFLCPADVPPAVSVSTATRGELGALALPRRGAEHSHELLHRAQVFQIVDGLYRPGDG